MMATEKAADINRLWSTWPVDALADFCTTLGFWYRGASYMYTEDDDNNEFQELTPFDYFEQSHPAEFAQYLELMKTFARKDLPLYRTILFEQATDLIDMVDSDTAAELVDSLTEQNTLFGKLPSADDFADFSAKLSVRKFSSWTLSPIVAYKLSFEGGMYQIGEGSVLVRTAPTVQIAHTTYAGNLFEQYIHKHHRELIPMCPAFMREWLWQKEYVVYAPKQEVEVDGILVASMENYEFYNRIMVLAGEMDEDEYGY